MSRDDLAAEDGFRRGAMAPVMAPPIAGGLRDMSFEGWALLRSILATAQHRWVWLLVAFVIPVLASIVAAVVVPSRFVGEALLVVSATRENTSNNEITGVFQQLPQADVQKLVQSEVDLMTSEAVVRRVFDHMAPERMYPELGERRLLGLLPPHSEEQRKARAADRLRTTLLTDAQNNSNVVRLFVLHRDRTIALQLLEAVLAAYMSLRNEVFANPAAGMLSGEVQRQGQELRQLESEITTLKERAGVLDIAQEIQLASQRLDQTIQRLDRLREQREAAQAAVLAAQTALAAQPQRVVAQVDQTNLAPNDEAANNLARLMQERTRMVAQYQPNAPMLVELENQIQRARLQVRESRGGGTQTQREVRNPAVELLTTRMLAARIDAETVESQEREVRRQRAEGEARNLLLLSVQRDLRDLERRRDAQDANFRQFSQREASARLTEEARLGRGAAVSLAQRPFVPANGRNLTPHLLAAGLVGGMGCAVAAAFILTFLRRTCLHPAEAERGTGLPALGVLPAGRWPANTGTSAAPIAGLAAQLLDAGMRGRIQILQFLGTEDLDERDRLARGLAIELARTHSKRVLLVDLAGDGRRHFDELGDPDQPPIPSDEGILAHETMVPRLWIAYQARDSDLARLHALETNVTFLADRLRRAFDLVLIIGANEVETYARRRLAVMMDGNILVIAQDVTRIEPAAEMIERVEASGGRFFGFFYTGATRSWMPA
ncbi:hypothetical protein [Sediminicoccus sp. KRV36]|uniref:GumC family protein n=1 Tax=Sediminicoccus sp. KRV36 TaxID=3133721 RepID=UPI0020102A9A|nr:hypothetical protein [Sediminicoccus rosea]UPY35793.1 hypothetical protein LHU95_16380 [Sediminicoccus rosea]